MLLVDGRCGHDSVSDTAHNPKPYRHETSAYPKRSTKDLFKGILVQVISDGEVLKSYNDPDASDNENPYHCSQYVEAVTGATFAIKVIITDQFDFCNISHKDGITVKITVDGFDWGHGSCRTRESLEKLFQTAEPWVHTYNEFKHFSDKTGQWMKSQYSFNALRLNESTRVKLLPAQMQHLGKIEISLQRAVLQRCEGAQQTMKPIQTIMEVSERTLKGKAVDYCVKPTEGRPAKAPKQRISATIETISGSRGKPLVHQIFYRSKRHLQMIGCIPPDPSSTAIAVLEDEDQGSASGATSINANTVAPGELLQQVQSLRAQLVLLERTLNVKSEVPDANTHATSQRPRNIKREREDDESAAPRQRRRISAKIETIDLTDD